MLTLALGIGANLTVFLLLYGSCSVPCGFRIRILVRIERSYPSGGRADLFRHRSALHALHQRSFDSATAYDYLPAI